MATNNPALTYPQSIKISSAAILFTITAQLTAVALARKSDSQMMSTMGKSFVQEETRRAVLRGVGCG
jgi:hypothetical protein